MDASLIYIISVGDLLIGGLFVTGLTADHRLNGARSTTVISGRLLQLDGRITADAMDRNARMSNGTKFEMNYVFKL